MLRVSVHVCLQLIFFSGIDTIQVGGSDNVRLSRADFNFVKAAMKPTVMALRLVDTLFSKEVLKGSTVHGTKEYSPLDHKVMTAIRGKLRTLDNEV